MPTRPRSDPKRPQTSALIVDGPSNGDLPARQGLQGRAPKPRRRNLTRPYKTAKPIKDLVGRDFTAEEVNKK